MKNLRLYTLPDDKDVLRAPNQEITFPISPEIQKLIAEMKVACRKAPGIGLAAPQVGRNFAIAIINLEEMGIPAFPIINPKIISKSIKKTGMEEGCLSIPGFYGVVRRPAKVEVEAYREDGQKILIRGDKLLAKVLQHEIDHLNGMLIIDKVEN